MRVNEVLIAGWLASLTACGSNSTATDSGAVGGSASDAGAQAAGDSSATGGPDATSNGCPAQRPGIGAACSGAFSCEYGQSACCGVTSSAVTCQCQGGTFSCGQTVECNFTCPTPDQ